MADLRHLTQRAILLLKTSRETQLDLQQEHQLIFLKQAFSSKLDATFYEPALCLILQGRKEITAGWHHFTFGVGELVIVSHQIPVFLKITEAFEGLP